MAKTLRFLFLGCDTRLNWHKVSG